MSGFSAVDMSTAAANGFRDGLAAQPAAAPVVDVAILRALADRWATDRSYTGSPVDDIRALIEQPTISTPASSADSAVLTNPYTGQPRDYRDVESDPAGTLIVEPGKPLEAASTPAAPGIDLEQFREAVEAQYSAGMEQWCGGAEEKQYLTEHRDRLLALIDASPKGGSTDACAWAGDGEGNWHTACGEIFTLMEGTPTDNKMRHCPYCGKNLRATSADVCVAVIGDSYEDTRSEAHDAARYRWLRDSSGNAASDTPSTIVMADEGGWDFVFGPDLDKATDAAMQATSAEVGGCTLSGKCDCIGACKHGRRSHGAGVSE